jgi:hypothetical protein
MLSNYFACLDYLRLQTLLLRGLGTISEITSDGSLRDCVHHCEQTITDMDPEQQHSVQDECISD